MRLLLAYGRAVASAQCGAPTTSAPVARDALFGRTAMRRYNSPGALAEASRTQDLKREYMTAHRRLEEFMARPKSEKSSADVAVEIRRLEHEKRRLICVEDQRRGAVIRECLGGPDGSDLRNALRLLVPPRDASLFQLKADECKGVQDPRSTASRNQRGASMPSPEPISNERIVERSRQSIA